MIDPEHADQLLARERARVENTLSTLREFGRGNLEASSLDQHLSESADQAEALTQSEIDDALAERLGDELQAITAAERRLRDGSYGKSIESGELIPDDRLEAIPWAERTVEEQQRYEGQ